MLDEIDDLSHFGWESIKSVKKNSKTFAIYAFKLFKSDRLYPFPTNFFFNRQLPIHRMQILHNHHPHHHPHLSRRYLY